MTNSRIEDLKRRLQRDPASIAFAQLGEEYRRAGEFNDAIETCKAGLAIHRNYLSARITLARCYASLGDKAAAAQELDEVLQLAPDNLVALRELSQLTSRSAGPGTDHSAAIGRLQKWLDAIQRDRAIALRK